MAAVKDDLTKKVKIKILSTDGDNSDVFLGFNGKNIVIKRNEVVEIDPEYIGILKEAKAAKKELEAILHDDKFKV